MTSLGPRQLSSIGGKDARHLQVLEKQGLDNRHKKRTALNDRRSLGRFPVRLSVCYREIGRGRDCVRGNGVTKNMSGKGVLFTTQSPLAEGMHVELLVDWPALLDGATRLRLVIQGRVKRSADAETALVIEHYEFRTRSALMAVAS